MLMTPYCSPGEKLDYNMGQLPSPWANVEIPRTDVAAATLHSWFDLDVELKSKLDFAKVDHEKVTVGAREYPHSAWLDIVQVYCEMGLLPCDPPGEAADET